MEMRAAGANLDVTMREIAGTAEKAEWSATTSIRSPGSDASAATQLE